jgi:hypothetical protein
MTVELINQFMILLIMYYLLLVSTNINSLLNCSIRRFLENNMYIKHIILFVGIYLWSFILKTYSPVETIPTNKEGFTSNYDFKQYSYLVQSFFYTLIIYLAFLMTSKMEVISFLVFITLLIVAFIINLLYKVNLNKLGLQKIKDGNFFITQQSVINTIKETKETKETIKVNNSEVNNVVLLYNILSTIYTSLPFLIAYGVYNYWKKQKKDHRKTFNTLTFFIGVENCRS